MIKLLRHNEINKVRWDECVKKSFNGNVYALSWYLDIVHRNWDALVENDYERVMPLTSSKKFGLSYMFQPFFVQQLGVFSSTQLSQETVDNFIKAIPEEYRLIQYRLNSPYLLSASSIFPIKENASSTISIISFACFLS